MPDVAAPRPDAEPVTITHNPSFDIRFLLLLAAVVVLSLRLRLAIYHTARRNGKLRSTE
jgi:hypothetical protein